MINNSKNFIRLFKPSLGNEEIQAIKKIFKKSWIGYGPEVKKFEKAWSKYIGIKYSVGVTSCSAALHIALASKNFKKKKKSFNSSNDFYCYCCRSTLLWSRTGIC